MIKRCYICGHFIWPWPWTHIGWRVLAETTYYWHTRCRT